jgi:hypothetical protein
MVRIINLLVDNLQPHLANSQVVLLLDIARFHVTDEVSMAATDRRIWLVFIPSPMTSLLQPLDIGVFNMKRLRFQHAYDHLRSILPGGQVSDEQWLRSLVRTIHGIMQCRNWSHIFEQVGADRCH